MDFEPSARSRELQERLTAFMYERVIPAEGLYEEQLTELEEPGGMPPVMGELRAEARARGLWNLFHEAGGYGLSITEWAPLAEIVGRSYLIPDAINCAVPDFGSIDVLTLFGTSEQRRLWLRPLLDGAIRSAFASSDASFAAAPPLGLGVRITRDGDEYVLDAHGARASGLVRDGCGVVFVIGETDPGADVEHRCSLVMVPRDTPGLEVVPTPPVHGFLDLDGHAVVHFDAVRVPVANRVGAEGDGRRIAALRRGPGSIYQCMRALGAAEMALETMARHAAGQERFNVPVAERVDVLGWIAEARVEIQMARLLTLHAAWAVDTHGREQASLAVAAIRMATPDVVLRVIERAIQVTGDGGLEDDFPLTWAYAYMRSMPLADRRDATAKLTIAGHEVERYADEAVSDIPR